MSRNVEIKNFYLREDHILKLYDVQKTELGKRYE